MVSALGKLYAAGCEVNWHGFHRNQIRARVSIPPTPFVRQRYWIEPHRRQASVAEIDGKTYPLLGQRLAIAGQQVQAYETVLRSQTPLNWADHQFGGSPLLPAAAYLEMVLAAGCDLWGAKTLRLRGISLVKGLTLEEESAIAVQTLLTQQTPDTYQFEIHSRDEQDWICHGQGTLQQGVGVSSAQRINIPHLQQTASDSLPTAAFYQRYRERGIDYGSSFRAVQQCWLSKQASLARIVFADSSGKKDFQLHPVLIDAGLQVAGSTLLAEQTTYLPTDIEELNFQKSAPPKIFWIYAKRRIETARPVIDIQWLDNAGETWLELKGLTLSPVPLQPSEEPALHWQHHLVWEPQATPVAPGGFLLNPAELATHLAAKISQVFTQTDFLEYKSLQHSLNTLAIAYMNDSLESLGWKTEFESAVTTVELVEQFGILPQHQQLFERCLTCLENAGFIAQRDGRWTKLESSHQQLAASLANSLRANPLLSAEMSLISRCGENLAAVLTGKADPINVLFPEGDLTELTQLYQTSVGARPLNQLVQAAVIATLQKSPSDRPLKILEIGAGTGGTTAELLPLLAELKSESGLIEYVFTDISPRFTAAAQARFQDFPFVEYTLLDIERAPQSQGFAATYDVVVAANVLHATADLQQTLTHVRELLAPGGELILLEGSQPVPWIDLIFGLTPGWWRFDDYKLRPDHPLISELLWRSVLQDTGFEKVQSLTEEQALLTQAVIVAQNQQRKVDHWWVLGEDESSTVQIQQFLAASGSSVERIDLAEVPNLARSAAKLVYVLPSAIANQNVPTVTHQLCETLLALVQTLVKRPEPPRLYLVTVEPTGEGVLAQSALWGFVQTLQFEFGQLRCTQIQAETLAQLREELLADSHETEVQFVDGQRCVARLQSETGSESPEKAQPTRLVSKTPGTLTGLTWESFEPSVLSPTDVVIAIAATGMNFRDVLIAMDQYPDQAALGCECVGQIVQVGTAVKRFQVGQRVLAIAGESYADQVTVEQDLVAAIPKHLGTSQAATLPVAFTTAYYCLSLVAKLQPGERVLIHGATGGVGQAAIQIAQELGAEIYATASPGKWSTLRDLGVERILNSRTLAFADEILQVTDGQGVDVVLNSLPGAYRSRSLDVLGQQGRFVEIGKGSGLTADQIAQQRPDVEHFTVDISQLCREQPGLVQSMLCHLVSRVEDGAWSPLPQMTFGKDQVQDAFRLMQQAKHVGKVVLTNDVESVVVRADGIYLITGGLGGLGLTVADWLIKRGAKQIALVSRREPSSETQKQLERFRDSGAKVLTFAVDVCDRKKLSDFISALPTAFGGKSKLAGVIHGAGILADAWIPQMKWAQFEQVLGPKVQGAWNLHELTQDLGLDWFVLFSSAAGLFGAPGQVNHASANAFLDGLARYRREQGLPALSIDWGAWGEVGAALKYQEQGQLKSLAGVEVITPEAGLAQLAAVWQSPEPQIGVVPINWAAFMAQPLIRELPLFGSLSVIATVNGSAQESVQLGQKSEFLAKLQTLPEVEQRAHLDQFLSTQVCKTLGFQAHELDQEKGFLDLGMDSLTALELKNSLQTSLGLVLPSTLIFDYPTAAALSDYLAEKVLASESEELDLAAEAEEETPTTPADAETDLTDTAPEPQADELAELLDQKLADIESLLGEDE
ncbi:MAG: SDR family NAD(P)-dependent oxidoreductase [Cyanobacteria bacterium P01_H01_bin.15]